MSKADKRACHNADEKLQDALADSRQRRAENLALLEASRAVLQYHNFEDAARAIFDSAKDLIGADSGYLALLSADGKNNDVLFLDSGGRPCSVDESLPMPIRGLRRQAYRKGKAVYDNDFANGKWMRFMPAGHVMLENVIFAPLVLDGEASGLLGLANKPGGFTENDARLATAFGEFAAIALKNSRAIESLEDGERRFRTLAETASDAIVCTDADGIVTLWNNAARKMFGYDVAEAVGKHITFIIPKRLQAAHRRAMNRVVLTGQSELVGKTTELVAVKRDGSEFPVELSLASWTAKKGVFFTGILRDITDRKRGQKAAWLSHSFLEIANRHTSLPPLLEEFVAEVKNFTGCDAVGIRVLAEDGGIPYGAYDGFSRRFYESESFLSIKSDQCMCISVITGKVDRKLPYCTEAGSFYMNGTTRFLAEVPPEQKGQTRNACNAAGYESVALIPIHMGGRILGLIHVADHREDAIPLEVVEAMETAAMQLGTAIQRVRAEEALHEAHDQLELRVQERTTELTLANMQLREEMVQRRRAEEKLLTYQDQLRSLAGELSVAEERERRRIATELHDRISQTLAATRIKLELVREPLAEIGWKEHLDDVLGLIEQACRDTSSLTFELCPPVLYELGLTAALQLLVEQFQGRNGIESEFSCDGKPDAVGDDVRAFLFRATRELLINVGKHAKASRVKVFLTTNDNDTVVTVEDDGIGLELSKVGFRRDGTGGFGLFSIRERLGHFGGRLEIESKPGQGTRLSLVVG